MATSKSLSMTRQLQNNTKPEVSATNHIEATYSRVNGQNKMNDQRYHFYGRAYCRRWKLGYWIYEEQSWYIHRGYSKRSNIIKSK